MSERTAYNLLDIHKRFDGHESVQNLHTLPRSVLYLLTAPSTPDEVREEAIDRFLSTRSIDRNERRNITKGQKAIAHAVLFPKAEMGRPKKREKKSPMTGDFGKELLRQARAVLEYAPNAGRKGRPREKACK